MNDTSTSDNPPAGLVGLVGDGIARICLSIAAIGLLCIVSINCVNVVGRYFFGSPISWAEELMLFLMVLVVYAGAVAVTWRNMHIRIDTLIMSLPIAAHRIANVFAPVVSIAVLVVVSLTGFQIVAMLRVFDQRSDALHLPMWIPQAFVTGGIGLMALLIVARLVTGRTR